MTASSCTPRPWPQALHLVGDPVDVITGAQTFFETDFRLRGEHVPISWTRHYDSRRRQLDRGIGHGFRLSFDVELRFDVDGMCFVNGEGETIEFPFVESDGERLLRGGHILERIAQHHFRVHPPGRVPSWEFRFERDAVARPSALFVEGSAQPPVRLQYDKGLLAFMQVDAAKRVAFEYAGQRPTGAVLLETGSTSKQRLVRYQYDGQGHLTEAEDAYGGKLRYEYDAEGRLSRSTDRRGYSFLFAYDGEGRCIHTRGEDGVEEYRFEYKPAERLTVATRGDGAITRYYFDEAECLVQVIDPCGGLTAYLKNDEGRVVAEVDPNGNKSDILYDDRDLPYAKRDPLGHVRPLAEDGSADPLAHVVRETPVEWEHGDWPGAPQPTPAGVPIGKWLPSWLVKLWGESPTSATAGSRVVRNIQGLPVREELPDGRARRWAFDFNGELRWETDFDGKTSRFELASWNHVQREIDALGSITEYGYTKSERVAAIVDPLGNRHEYRYDLKDRLVEVARNGKVRERYAYDAANNLIEKRDGQGNILLQLAIGAGNLPKQRILASGDLQELAYTKDGRLEKATNRAGALTFAYDPAGHRTEDERDGTGVRHRYFVDRLAETTVLGRFTTRYLRVDATTSIVVDPGGQTQRLRLTGPGLVERSCSNDVEELAHYDLRGQCLLKAATGGGLAQGWAKRFVYSGEGDLLRRDDSARGTTNYEYDDAHRLAKVIHADGRQDAYCYDRAGNLLQAPGLQASVQAGNRLLDANDDRFTYNERDHVAVRTGRLGTFTYAYDSRDLLVGIDGPGVQYRAAHDALGRRTQKTVNGQTWHFYWDSDRLAAEIQPDGRIRVYVYPDAVALVPMLFLDYEGLDADLASGRRYHIYADHLGCPERVLDDAGKTVWQARIDAYGTAHVDVGADFHQPLRWPGHYYDAETDLHDNRFRTYSPELGRYLQSDPRGTDGNLNLYAYTNNPLREVDIRGDASRCPNGKDCPRKKKQQAEGGDDREVVRRPAEKDERSPATGKRVKGAAEVVEHKVNGEVVAKYYLDEHGRTIRAEGRLDPPADYTKKGVGGMDMDGKGFVSGRDDRGHLVPERSAANQQSVNVPENVVSEHGTESNRSVKKRWENQARDQAEQNPGSWSVHEPQYDSPTAERPSSVTHNMYDGDGNEIPGMKKNITNPE